MKSQKKYTKKENQNIEYGISQKFVTILLLVTATFGFYFRVANVGELSLWVDEYVHVLRAKDFVEGAGPLLTNDNNGILYTLFIIPFFYLFDTSEFWARIPSVLFGTGSIYLIYLLGKRLFNKNIGLISSVIMSFSLYNVYWSRISRNYAIFMFFYLLVLLFFIKGFENKENTESTNTFKANGINLKYLSLFVGAFLLSLLSHQLTFLFIFGAAVYFIGGEIISLINKKTHNYKNKYFILSIASITGLILIFLPFASSYVNEILGYFLPDKIVTWVIPNWEQLSVYYKETPFKIFNVYFDVIKNDYPVLYWLGIAGLPISFFINRKSGIFLISMFVIPFSLMSFIFKDPSLPRYLIFIYPLFLISISVILFAVTNIIFKKIFTKRNTIKYTIITAAIPVIIALFFIQTKNLESVVKVKKEQGLIIDKSLSHWSFTNWKYPAKYVKNYFQEGDLILSTVPPATEYYTGIDTCIHFRQRYYDTTEKGYKNYEPNECEAPCARTYEDLRNILMNYERGWLLADYYFYNVMTDPRARALVCRYMNYHPQSNNDGGVLVFSWNKKNPPPVPNQTMLYVLGKSEQKQASDELSMNLKPGIEKRDNLRLVSYARSVSKNEMYVLINKKHRIAFPPTKNQNSLEQVSIKLKPGILNEGKNTFRFFYNKNVTLDEVKGFSVHHLAINAG